MTSIGGISLSSVAYELKRIEKEIERNEPPVAVQTVEVPKKAVSVADCIKELTIQVTKKLEELPQVYQKSALQKVRGKIEEVRGLCYKDISYFSAGQAAVLLLADSLCSLIKTQSTHFAHVPSVVLDRAFIECSPATVEVLVACLAKHEQSSYVQNPVSLDAYPKEFHQSINLRINEALQKVPVLDHDAPEKCQKAIAGVLDKLNCRLMKEAIDYIFMVKSCLDEGMDGSSLLGLALKLYEEPTVMKAQVFTEFKAIVTSYYKRELQARNVGSPADCLKRFDHLLKDVADTLPLLLKTKKDIFRYIVAPHGYFNFCRRLALKKLPFSELLWSYSHFSQFWNGDILTFQGLEAALKRVCPRLYPQSLVPEKKTEVCIDTSGFSVRIHKKDPVRLYAPIEVSSILQPKSIAVCTKPIHCNSRVVEGFKCEHSFTQGRRPEMEDTAVINSFRLSDGTVCPIFAIMDGHAGKYISEYLAHVLVPTVEVWLEAALYEKGDIDSAISNAMKVGMIQLNHIVKNAFGGLADSAGSCAIFCFIYKDNVYTVNIGDSRAVISTGQQLSEDATALAPRCVKKIQNRNGFVQDERVNGGILPFSTFGDFTIKPVSAFAQTHIHKLNGQPARLGIMCDGLTDVFTSKQISLMLEAKKSPFDIVADAINKGASDNISLIVVDIPAQGKKL